MRIAEIVAELKETNPDELSTTYECIDHLVDHLFSNPPPGEADAQLEFTYEGYRIHLTQDGEARFRKAP